MTTSFKLITVFFGALVFLFSGHTVQAANLFLFPAHSSYKLNDTFIVEVRIDTEREDINAVEVNLVFPPNMLEVISLETGSIFDLWIKRPEIDAQQANLISFVGGVSGGYNGDSGFLARILFKAKSRGIALLEFQPSSRVLLDDGLGTEAPLSFLSKRYSIFAAQEGLVNIFSSSHPDETQWYSNDTLEISWTAQPEAKYSYILTNDFLATVDDVPDDSGEQLKFNNLKDGVHYFQIRERLAGQEWSEKASYRVMIDTTKPESFTPRIAKDPTVFGGDYFVVFSAQDVPSGIAYYEVNEGDGNWQRVSSPHLLDDQSLGGEILIRAVDRAGNSRAETAVLDVKTPFRIFLEILLYLISALVGIIIINWLWRRTKRSRHKFR